MEISCLMPLLVTGVILPILGTDRTLALVILVSVLAQVVLLLVVMVLVQV